MRKQNSLPVFIFIVIFVVGLLVTYGLFKNSGIVKIVISGIISFLIALAVSIAIKVADQWEKAVVLRLGKFHGLKGPGLFLIIPIVDSVA
jgi:regulator of protease activity HflC (stomatin/prohibitin superfamily)